MEYKYKLRRKGKKEICPSCGKKEFVPYEDKEGNLAGPQFGMCDRLSKCAYKLYPTSEYKKPKITEQKIMKTYVFDRNLVIKTMARVGETTFAQWLNQISPNAPQTLKIYGCGLSKKWDRSIIFWRIDYKKRIRTGKIMGYQVVGNDCKRVKEPPQITWVHAGMQLPDDHEVKGQLLFGEHLLATKPEAPVIIVESEKSALFGHCLYPDFIWLATGGMQNFTALTTAVLYGSEVFIIPDVDGFKTWKAKYYEFSYLFKATFIDCAFPDCTEKADIVDVYLNGYTISELEALKNGTYFNSKELSGENDSQVFTEPEKQGMRPFSNEKANDVLGDLIARGWTIDSVEYGEQEDDDKAPF